MTAGTLMLLLLTAYFEVFFEVWFDGFRLHLGTQVSLLPALMVYAGLTAGFPTILVLGVTAGYLYDSLSVNPLGVSVLPLLAVGVAAFLGRDYLLRDLPMTQVACGAVGTLLAPVLTLFLLATLLPQGAPYLPVLAEDVSFVEGGADGLGAVGLSPSWSWWTGYRLIATAGIGALATPLLFRLFDWLNRHFCYASASPVSYRDDRQIIRGRR